ncbi:helix-turn-helix domain-containing protein [Ktedonobacter robiniae]|uniref:helix-turn-helix domain-containing protein n=1 Tax=Ktedonobacter robiniae TaxID=2778365 RepID=UPI001F23B36B|nr:helix-turn-helix domain-containing protein [Ktedonobacter robiniae]
MPKRATAIRLSEKEREELTRLTKRHRSEQQVALRARIVLAAEQGASNAQIARDLTINVDTVRLWRDRWARASGPESDHEEGREPSVRLLQRLQDAPRPGAVPKFTAEQRAQMAALACEAPAKTGRPISQWTGREIADELKQRGIVTKISPRHAARLLKKGLPTTPVPLLADRGRRPAARRENCGGLSGLCTSRRASQTRRTHHQHG